MSLNYTSYIEEQILSHLDGWVITTSNDSPPNNDGEVEPFIENIGEYADNPNKKVSQDEVQQFYENAIVKAYTYTNRLNIDDLNTTETDLFIRGVCLLAASDLWNKYNIRVNNEDMEDTYVQSYGGLLYKQAITILKSFINQRITGLSNFKKSKQDNNDIWII